MDDHGERCRPLVRLNYFTGQVLTIDDLQAEQSYVRDLHRRHIRACHGWGVVEGLNVARSTGDHRLLVEPGLALSPRGDEICVPDRVEVDLEPLATASAVAYVAIRATETKVHPVPVVDSGDASAVEWSRIRETFELAVLDALPLTHDRWDRGGSLLRVLWRSVRRRVSGLRRSQRREAHHTADTPAATPDDDWVVLVQVARTRVARGGEHIRFVAGVRRDLR